MSLLSEKLIIFKESQTKKGFFNTSKPTFNSLSLDFVVDTAKNAYFRPPKKEII